MGLEPRGQKEEKWYRMSKQQAKNVTYHDLIRPMLWNKIAVLIGLQPICP